MTSLAGHYARLAKRIEAVCGIKLPENKRCMVESRLRRHLRKSGWGELEAYYRYLFREGGLEHELPAIVDVITTNKTDFFREDDHFETLTHVLIPRLEDSHGAGLDTPLRVWSAACSSGQEPYTLAMVLADYATARPGFDFDVYASDISPTMLDQARRGIYPLDALAPIPERMRRAYLLKARDPERREFRVAPEIRAKVHFAWYNLLEGSPPFGTAMHVVFCRNVIMYFDQPAQAAAIHGLADALVPGGFLVVGHSETAARAGAPLRLIAPTVYERLDNAA
jgi:chemotaxis protein methyltransferase CheR